MSDTAAVCKNYLEKLYIPEESRGIESSGKNE